MLAKEARRNGKLYSQMLLGITVGIVLTLVLSSFFFYFAYSRTALKEAYETDLGNLMQTSKEVVAMTESAQSLSFQMYRNNTISKLLFYTKPDIYEIVAAMNEMNGYLSSMPFIESIYVYNAYNGQFYLASREGQNGIWTRDELVDTNILTVLEQYQQFKPFTPIPRIYASAANAPADTSVYTYLCYDAINKTQTMNSAVIVNISAAYINKDMGIKRDGSEGASFILDEQDRLIAGDSLSVYHADDAEWAKLSGRIQSDAPGYMVADFAGTKSLISYTSADSLDWQYVRVTPYSVITASTINIRNLSLLLAAVIMAAGLLISWLLSRILYVPIQQIVDKMNMLETEKRDSQYAIRQNLLRSVIQGVKSPHAKRQLDKLYHNNLTFDFNKDYRIVHMRIEGLKQLQGQRDSDTVLYKFAVMNIAWEIASQSYKAETVDMDDGAVAMLMNPFDASKDLEDEAALLGLLEQIQHSCMHYLQLGLTITFSPVTNQALHLPLLYRQVKEASMHKLFYGSGSIINAQTVMTYKSKPYAFPADKEKKLTEALMTGRMEEAKALLSDICEETADYPIHILQLAVSHLTMTINSVISTIQKNGALDLESGLQLYPPAVDGFESIEELKAVFYEAFDAIRARLVEKRSMKQDDLIRKINDLIKQNYADMNLCLNEIARTLDMSPVYISRIYKQQTMTAIVDAINQVRLDIAKEHLERTDWSIVDIAEKSGYASSSYFHRLFKKSFGVTPADYRRVKQQYMMRSSNA